MARRSSPFLSAFLVLVVIGLCLGAIYGTRPDPPRPLAPAPNPAPVHLRTLALETRPLTARIYGQATPWRQARLAAELSGVVVWRSELLENGGRVEAGAELLRLDPEPFDLALDEAAAAVKMALAEWDQRSVQDQANEAKLEDYRAQEQLAELDWERARGLLANGDVAEKVRDDALKAWLAARSALKQAEQAAAVDRAAVQTARAALERTEAARDRARDTVGRSVLRAPFAGEVSAPSAEVGDWLLAGSPVCLLVDRDRLKLRAPLPTEESIGVGTGTPVQVVVPALIGESGEPVRLEAQVLGLDPVATAAARARELVVAVSNRELGLPAGAFVEMTVQRGERLALWLRPQEYQTQGGQSHAYVIGPDGRAERREVRLGRPVLDQEDRAWHPVLGGLAAGERLVTDNLEMLADGAELMVLED
ncbi:MAG: efflux RND transporter periplasmic adaptor subunit [Planctomycetes bacterium]|nr:efflux RND transporter periplasmic adaptor subunit [Planctomycetota bacterium]MBL7008085.1 efflux RND transporter periplasmic adaptor subunit [Planctomycetota bacterium]